MKFGKISSIALAAALMATSSAVIAYADANVVSPAEAPEFSADGKWLYVRLVTENDERGMFASATDEVLKVAGVRYTVTGETWATGSFALNSKSTGWKEIGWNAGTTVTWGDNNTGIIEYKASAPVFAASDNYAQLCLGMWNDITSVDKIEILDKDGNAIWTLVRDGDKYVEETAAAEETKEEETKEETKEEAKEETKTETKEEDTKKDDKKEDTKKDDTKKDDKKEDTKKDDKKEDTKKSETLTLADCFTETNNTVILVGENGENAYFTANDLDITDVYGYKVTVEVNPDAYDDEETWIGGGIGANSNSTGWLQNEWGRSDKDYILEVDDYVGTVEWLSKDAVFSADDKYAQLWFSVWSEPSDLTVTKVEVLGKKGKVIAEAEITAAETDAEDTAVDTEEDEDEDLDEDLDEEFEDDGEYFEDDFEDDGEEFAEDEDVAAEEAAAEVDWSAYDADAAKAKNDAFELGGAIDLYAALGDSWPELATVEATFTWDAGTGWCGGAGIGGGAALEDGTAWISGPEFGAANANEGVVNDGKVTQTLIDITGTPLAQIAAVNDDGTMAFGEIQIQKWWNCDEANAKVQSVTFKDASGNVLAELTYGDAASVDATVEETPAETTTTPVVVDNGGAAKTNENPSTGVADLAAAMGIAFASAGIVVLSRKRK